MYKLNILWTTDVRENFFDLVATYAYNSVVNCWWDHVNIIIWGKSANLVAKDAQVRDEIVEMISMGISVEASKECCDKAGISASLKELGIKIDYMGSQLTSYMKSGDAVLTI